MQNASKTISQRTRTVKTGFEAKNRPSFDPNVSQDVDLKNSNLESTTNNSFKCKNGLH